LRVQKHTKHKGFLAPALETSKTADMKKSDIPITQIGDEVKVVDEEQLQSNF
jgi:acetolactate synthase regulatory subunit